MTVAEVGVLVRAYRKATGLSQKDLAAMAGMSRATLNYLESGRDIEIGAAKLLALLDLLGVPFDVPSVVDRVHDDVVLERAAKAAGGKAKLPRKAVVEALATGMPPDGTGPALLRLLEAASDAEALAIVRAVSAGTGQPPKAVWKHGRVLAARLGCARPVWQHGKD